MRTSMRNNKGFTLIELLIVIAILGVLAVIAFQSFGGILGTSKEKADYQTADLLEKQMELLLVDSGVVDITADNAFFTALDAGGEPETALEIDAPGSLDGLEAIIAAMQSKMYRKDPRTGQVKHLGPYLEDSLADASASNTLKANQYLQPQFDPASGGTHMGYSVGIDMSTGNVMVKPIVQKSDGSVPPGSTFTLTN